MLTDILNCLNWDPEETCLEQSDVLSLDFSKVGFLVRHHHLHEFTMASTQVYYGITWQPEGWIRGFLAEGAQCLAMDGESSELCPAGHSLSLLRSAYLCKRLLNIIMMIGCWYVHYTIMTIVDVPIKFIESNLRPRRTQHQLRYHGLQKSLDVWKIK